MMEIKQQLLTEDLKKQIHEGLRNHAITTTGIDEKFELLTFVAYEKECFAGAIVMRLFWGALHIKNLYVDDKYRGRGIATLLMEEALKYGRNNKCPFMFVETLSFQALGFYEKMGFELEFTRSGYKNDTSFHYLRKNL